jgi:hypothetical protein
MARTKDPSSSIWLLTTLSSAWARLNAGWNATRAELEEMADEFDM